MNKLQPDFDQLAFAAHPEIDRHGSIEALDALWKAVFLLDEWHFLGEPKTIHNAIDGAKPFQWDRKQDGTKWLLLFTDLQRAKLWAATQDFGAGADRVNFLSIKQDEARAHFRSLIGKSVAGIRFNEGSKFGWMAPLEDIDTIFGHLANTTRNHA